MSSHGAPTCVLFVATLAAATVQAQRVDENAIVQAQDAFGITVGDEEIGLYSAGDARGFSPKDAGNLVIEGLYYDQQTYEPTARIIEGSVLRVGLSAQSYPSRRTHRDRRLPAAPTGPRANHQHLARRRPVRLRLRRSRYSSCHWLPR
jgi:hypothetical protein